MINELIIHMGDTKTGSTSIQRVLSHEMWNAPDRSIVYPALSNHNGLAMTLTQKRAFDKRPVRFERLYEKFTTSDAEFGIISAEHFQFVDPRVFDEAVRTFWPDLSERMRLVAYVRPHASKILSAFAERVKLGLSDSLEQFIDTTAERSLFDYAPRFESWREVFGERFTLRPFIREQLHKGDAVQDFFRFVFGDEEFHIAGEAEANSSLSLSQLAVMRDLHEHMRSRMPRGNAPRIREVREAIGRLVAEHLRASSLGQDGGKLRLPSSAPYLFASLKIGIAASLVGAIVGELPTGAVRGLGARLLTGSYYGQTIQIWSALFATAILAALLVAIVAAVEKLTLRRMGVRT